MNIFVENLLREAGFDVTRQFLHHDERISINGTEVEVPPRWNVLGVRYPRGKWNGKSVLFFGHTDTVDVKQGWESDPFSISRRIVDGRELWFGLGANDMKGGLAAELQAVLGIPTLTLGPFGAGSHTNHEWVGPQSVVKVANILNELIAGS